MQTQLIETFCICLGYFDIQIKMPFRTFLFAIGKLYSLLFIIYFDSSFLYTQNIENNFQYLIPFQIELLLQILDNYIFQNNAMLITNIIMILAICFIILNHFSNRDKENIDENVKQNIFFNMFLQLVALLYTLLNCAFIQPLLIFGLYNIKYSTINSEYFWIVNDIIFLSFFHILSFIYFAITEGALIIQQNQNKKLQLTFFEYAQFLLLHVQPYILIFSNQNAAIYIQSLIYLLITFFEGISIFSSKVYSNQSQTLISIIVHSCGIYISIFNISHLEKPIVLLILLVLFNIQITCSIYNSFIMQICLKDAHKLTLNEIHFLLCLLMAKEQLQPQKLCIINAIKMYEHQTICQNTSCICKRQNNGSSDPLQFFTLADFFQSEIRSVLVNNMKKQIQNQEPQDSLYFFCHFLYAQHLFGEIYEIYSKIENQEVIENFTKIQKIKWRIFIIIIKQNLFNNFTAKVENYSKDQTVLSIKISSFVQSESFNQSIRDGMIIIIQKKIDYQINILTKTNDNKLIANYYELISDIEKQEKVLQMIYDKFPSQKNQSQLMFFFAEIKHDWQKAYDKLQINAIDNQFLNYANDIDVNQLANKMSYLIFSFENRNLKIQSFSKRAPHIFGYDQKYFETIQESDILIPKSIRELHNAFIEKFLTDGKGHFFRKKAHNICQLKNGLLQNVDFFYDLYFDNKQCFRFIAFFCISEQNEPIILVDKNNKIQGVNKELFKKINFSPSILDMLQLDIQFYSLPAHYFIPENILNNEDASETFQLSFPKENIFQSILKQNNFNLKQQYLKKNAHFLTYEVNCEVFYRQQYKIFKFKKIQETYQLKKFLSIDAQSLMEIPLQVNQEESITHPYDENVVSPEDPLTINVMLETQRKTDQNLKILSDEEKIQMSRYSLRQNQYDYSESYVTDLEDKTIQILGNVYQQDLHNVQGTFAGGSQTSMAGLRRSKFFRKYSLLNQLNQSQIHSPLIFKIFSLLKLALITQTIYLTFNIVYSKQDFKDLNYYYESVQINHYFIEPMQKFFLTRYLLQDYQITYYGQGLTIEKLAYYQKFIMPLLVDSYEQFKLNFQEHFQDESFSKFIEDKYVSVKQQTYHYSPIKLQEFNVTLFNAFSILLDAFYKQQQIYVKSSPTKGTNPHNTFQYVNYILFVTIFDEISDQIFEESITQIDLVVERWISLVTPITIIITLLFLAFGYYYNYYNHLLEKFFALSIHIEPLSIESDKQRQQFILQTLKSGSDIIYKYKFNLGAKEDILKKKSSKHRKEKLGIQETRQSYNSISISKFNLFLSMILFQFQFMIIAGPITFIGVNYLQNFPDTISFFKSVSDIGVYVPAAFSQKEIIYYFFYFSYFTANDRKFFVDQIQKAVDKIDLFLNLDINQENLQFSSEFLEKYQYIEKNNLCQLLNSSKYYDFDYFCYNSQNGILKLGLIPTLNRFDYILKSELAIDFPSDREFPPQEELEAVYLCSDVITEITLQMEEDIKNQTKKIENIYDIINGVTLTFTIMITICIYQFVLKDFKLKLQRTMKISLTFPLETIFTNDHFERELRRIATNENLI